MTRRVALNASVVIRRPIMEVFDYVANPSSVARWVPFYSQTSAPEELEGYATRFQAQLSLPWYRTPVDVEVVDIVPGRRIAYRAIDLGQTTTMEFQSSSNGTLVTATHSLWSWQGLAASIWWPFFEPWGNEYLEQILETLRGHLEGRNIGADPLIFFSYRRATAKYVGGRIFDALGDEFGIGSVFRDIDSLMGGGQWRRGIEAALQECAVVLLHIGDDWEDELVKRARTDRQDVLVQELTTAMQNPDTTVIPVFTSESDGFSMAPRLERLHRTLSLAQSDPAVREARRGDLATIAKALESIQGIFLRTDPDFRRDFDRLVHAVWAAIRGPLSRGLNAAIGR